MNIAECANSSHLNVAGARWLARGLPAEWESQGTVDVSFLINGDVLVATDEVGLLASFFRDIPGTNYTAHCEGFASVQATVAITECANTSSIEFDGQTFFGHLVPVEWQDRETVPVSVLGYGGIRTATGDDGLRATFHLDVDQDGQLQTLCLPFGVEPVITPLPQPTTTTMQETTTTTIVVEESTDS